MTASYTFDVFSSLDGFGAHTGDWGGYWGKLAAGLVDRVQVTVFPVITGQTGADPVFGGAADFDLELLETCTLDGNTQELIYRPTLHG